MAGITNGCVGGRYWLGAETIWVNTLEIELKVLLLKPALAEKKIKPS